MGTNATDAIATFNALRALLEQDADDVADLPNAWDQTRSMFIALDEKRLSGRLLTELRDAESQDNVRSLLEHVHEVLAEKEMMAATSIVFETMEFDDGYFLSQYATVCFGHDEPVPNVDFGDWVAELLTEEYSKVGHDAAVGIDLRTDWVEFGDHSYKVREALDVREDDHQSALNAYRAAIARHDTVWDVHNRLNDKAEADEISYSEAEEYRETNCLDATERTLDTAQELLGVLGYESTPGRQRSETPMPCCDSDEDWLHRRDPAEFDGDGDFRRTDTPEDITHDNLRRAGFALIAVQAFAKRTGADYECVLCDLLCDLMHLADATDQDFDIALDRGRYHYDADRKGEP